MDKSNPLLELGANLHDELSTSEQRLQTVIELSSDYYWEQDENHRFTLLRHRDMSDPRNAPWRYVGKTSWELGGIPLTGAQGWEEHKTLRRELRPFTDFVICRFEPPEGRRYLSISGQPVFDSLGAFKGYRGITRDVTREQQDLRLLRLERAVTRILTDARESGEALVGALRAICESEGWDAGQHWYLDSAEDVMRYHVGWTVADPVIERVARQARRLSIPRGVSLVGVVWDSGRPLWISDLAKESERLLRKDIVQQTGWHASMLFPVVSQGRTIGVLDFNSTHVQAEPDERLLQVINLVAAQIGNFHERALTLERLRESEERYADTVELAAIGISHVAADGRLLHVNRRLCEMLAYTREELLQLTVKQISHPDDANATDASARLLRAGEIESFKVEKRYLRKDGVPVWVRISAACKRAADGAHLYDISVVEDISERKRAEDRIQYMASHDEMTDLANRATFVRRLEGAIREAEGRRERFAVLFVDLDRFKNVNDTLGHEAGDLLLKETARKLKRCLEPADLLARFGGDEFVVLTQCGSGARHAEATARNLISAAIQPVAIHGHECRVTASVGVAVFPEDGLDAQSLIKNADMAMYAAKEEGKNTFQFYCRDKGTLSVERLALETALRSALERDEFSIQYQPQVSIETGRITGAEALLRWWSRDLGSVSPVQFIPVAEESGLIVPIGLWVLETACTQAMAWQRAGLEPLRLAVNLSQRQLKDPKLVGEIERILATTGLPPHLLELEITESMIMHKVEQAVEVLGAIKRLGVRLAIDDFGTGYSSLAQLKRFPIDTLKVDRSFIREIPEDAEDMAITEAIIAMGRTLGVTVIAEGVESEEQCSFLSLRACDEIQGYYFARPCHPDQMAEMLRAQPVPKD